MSLGGNNSRNIANLLKFQPLEPLKVPNQTYNSSQSLLPRQRILPSHQQQSQHQQISFPEAITVDQGQKRNSRRIAPLSSDGVNNRSDGGPRKQFYFPDNQVTQHNSNSDIQMLKARLDQVVKYYDQRHTNLESKIMIKVNQVENFVARQLPKMDNNIIVTADITSLKQSIKDLRRQQQLQFKEIRTIKATSENSSRNAKSNNLIDQNQLAQLHEQSNKDKQKLSVLFMQLVRLGDTVQKLTDQANRSTRSYQNKIQNLEQKLLNSQKNISIISQRTSSGSQVLSELGQKVMSRLQSTENNILVLGKEQIRDKDVMNKIVAQNQRIGEDLNTMITNMQTDFQNKLENKISETIQRLVYEHEQRVKDQEDIKKNLNLMERINLEKQESDKMQNKARLENMDSAVRNQFIKKQQSIRTLQNSMEQQFRSLLVEIQNQGGKRKQQQTSFRYEIKKVQDSFRKEYDLYKNHQQDLVQKITDMIKAQIQVRLSSEIDLKKLTGQIANELVLQLSSVKEAISSSNKKLNLAIKEVSNDSAERSSQLSHYIDQQVRKVVDIVTEKYSKMKNVFTKLAEQFKNHLINTETNRKNHEGRLSAIQQDFQKLKSQVNTQIDEFYNDLQARLKQQKQFVQTVVFKKNNDLTLRVNKLEEYTNQYFDVLKAGIEDNKELLNNNKSGVGNNGRANMSSSKGQESQEEIKQLRTLIFDIKNITQEIKTDNQESYRKLQKQLQDIQARNKEEAMQMGNSLNTKIKKNQQAVSQIQTNLDSLTVKVNGLRTESGSQTAISSDRLKKLSDQITDLTKRIKDLDEKLQEESDKTDKELIRVRSDITVIKGEVGALDDDIKKLSSA